MNKERFNGKIAIVTGGGTGIGAAIAKQLAWEGATVVVMGRRLEKLQDTVSANPDKIIPMAGDVAKEEDIKKVIADTMDKFGRIDLLANAAGIGTIGDNMEDIPIAQAKALFDINFWGTYIFVHEVLPIMKAQKAGAIVNIASIDGMMGYDGEADYAASKAGVISLAKCVATENGRTGVRINAIAPGWIDTPMLQVAIDSYNAAGIPTTKETLKNGSMDRPGYPEEIAEGACFLLSDEASYINGHTLVIDGAKTLG